MEVLYHHHGPPCHHIPQYYYWSKSNDARWRESTEYDVFHFFVNNAPQITVAGDLVPLLQQEIESVFVGRFRCGLQLFQGRKALSSIYRTHLKIVARWRYTKNCQVSSGSAKNGGQCHLLCSPKRYIMPCNLKKCFGGFL